MLEQKNLWSEISILAKRLGETLRSENRYIATAESCTGGGIGYAISEVAGSSQWFLGGVTAYSNRIKHQQLQVASELINSKGAVSEEVVAAMVQGVVTNFSADVGIAVSGVAGPGGGSIEKPVGTICFGWYAGDNVWTQTQHFDGDRELIRLATIHHALEVLLNHL